MADVTKEVLLAREQFYINMLFKLYRSASLNLSPQAGSTKGYKHKPSFSLNRLGNLNPMYGRIKSPEFLAMQTRNRKGTNNPQFGIKKSILTVAKITKFIHVYDSSNLNLIGTYGTVECARKFKMGTDTLKKYLKNGLPYKGKIFSLNKLDST
jgi:group I intron endonuclease